MKDKQFYQSFLLDVITDIQSLKTVSGYVVRNELGQELCEDGSYRHTYRPRIIKAHEPITVSKLCTVEPVREWAERQIESLHQTILKST